MRQISDSERQLISFLLEKVGMEFNIPDNVVPMKDGEMGSISFDLDASHKRSELIARGSFSDIDGVIVSFELTADENGSLFELDMWKVDFSPLESFPELESIKATLNIEIEGWSGTRIFDIHFPKSDDDYNLGFIVSKYHEILKFGDPGEFLTSAGILWFHYASNIHIDFSLVETRELYIDQISLLGSHKSPNGKFEIINYEIILDSGSIKLTATEMHYEIKQGPIKSSSMYIVPN